MTTTPTDPSIPDPDSPDRVLSLAEYSPAALARADALHAVGRAAYRDPRNRFRVSAAMPLPRCLIEALAGVWLHAAEGPWPHFCAFWHDTSNQGTELDWSALIAVNPADLAWAVQIMTLNQAPAVSAITEAHQLLAAAGTHPRMDVWLWVEPDGRIGVEPRYLTVPTVTAPALVEQVTAILSTGGRPRAWLDLEVARGVQWRLS